MRVSAHANVGGNGLKAMLGHLCVIGLCVCVPVGLCAPHLPLAADYTGGILDSLVLRFAIICQRISRSCARAGCCARCALVIRARCAFVGVLIGCSVGVGCCAWVCDVCCQWVEVARR